MMMVALDDCDGDGDRDGGDDDGDGDDEKYKRRLATDRTCQSVQRAAAFKLFQRRARALADLRKCIGGNLSRKFIKHNWGHVVI
jgi:hypothetical protein